MQLTSEIAAPRGIEETEHNSTWTVKNRNIDALLTSEQKDIVKNLIQNNQWIIEESNDIAKTFDTLNF